MDQWSEHIEICGSRTEKCGFCNEYIKLMDMEEHINSGCKYGVKPKPIHDEFYEREHEIDSESDYFKMMSHITRSSEFDNLLEASDYTNMLINGNAHRHHEVPSDFITHPDDRPIHPLHRDNLISSTSLNDAFIDNSPIITEDDPEIQKAIEESLKQDYKNDLPPIDSKPVSLVTGPTPGTKRNTIAKSKYDEFKQSSLPQPPPPPPLPQQQKPPIQTHKNKPPTSHSSYLQPTAASKKRVSSSSSSKREVNNTVYQPPPSSSSSSSYKTATTTNGPKTPLKDKNTKARPRKSSGASGVSRVEYNDLRSDCKECGKSFPSQAELDHHIKTYHGVKSSGNKKLPPQSQPPPSNPRYNTPPTRITNSKSYNRGTTTSSHSSANPPSVVRNTHSQSSSNLNSFHNEVVYDEEDPELQMALQMSLEDGMGFK